MRLPHQCEHWLAMTNLYFFASLPTLRQVRRWSRTVSPRSSTVGRGFSPAVCRSSTTPVKTHYEIDTPVLRQKVNCAERKRGRPGPLVRNDNVGGFAFLPTLCATNVGLAAALVKKQKSKDLSLRTSAHTGVAISPAAAIISIAAGAP